MGVKCQGVYISASWEDEGYGICVCMYNSYLHISWEIWNSAGKCNFYEWIDGWPTKLVLWRTNFVMLFCALLILPKVYGIFLCTGPPTFIPTLTVSECTWFLMSTHAPWLHINLLTWYRSTKICTSWSDCEWDYPCWWRPVGVQPGVGGATRVLWLGLCLHSTTTHWPVH